VIFLALCLFTASASPSWAEAKVIEHEGKPGFFLERSDMEECVNAMNKSDILEADIEKLKADYAAVLHLNDELAKALRERDVAIAVVGFGAAALAVVAFVVGALLPF